MVSGNIWDRQRSLALTVSDLADMSVDPPVCCCSSRPWRQWAVDQDDGRWGRNEFVDGFNPTHSIEQPRTSWLTWIARVIVIQLSKWTPGLRWCQLVGLQYHQVRRYCSQVDDDAGGWCTIEIQTCMDWTWVGWTPSTLKRRSKAVYRLCSSGRGGGHVHPLFSASAVGPHRPIVWNGWDQCSP